MNRSYHNIDKPVRFHTDHVIGYRKSDGQAVRVYRDKPSGWRFECKSFKTLADVSAYLESL
jgi:uncharacterized heparinase superfamily protein